MIVCGRNEEVDNEECRFTGKFYAFVAGLATVVIGFVQTKCAFDSTDALAVTGLVASYVIGRSWVKAKSVEKTEPQVKQTVNVKPK